MGFVDPYDFITEIENDFSIKFKLKDLNKMRNVGDMIDIISSKL